MLRLLSLLGALLACLVLAGTAAAHAAEPASPDWSYRVVSQSYRQSMAQGSSQLVTVTARNTGRRPWLLTGDKRVRLQVESVAPPQAAAVAALRAPAIVGVASRRAFRGVRDGHAARPLAAKGVKPGELAVLNVRLQAPVEPATYVTHLTVARRQVAPLR